MPTYTNGWNPASLSFNYQKNSGIIPNAQAVLYFPKPAIGNPSVNSATIIQKPSWLQVVLNSASDDGSGNLTFDYTIGIESTQANVMSLGFHSAQVKAQIVYQIPLPSGSKTIKVTYTLPVNIQVTQQTPLSISQATFNFSQFLGDPAPAAQFLQITSGNNWSISANFPWVSFSTTNGSGSQTIGISVDPSGLGVGMHTSIFIVDNGNETKTGTIFFEIKPSGSEDDYVSVNPQVLQFSSNHQQNTSTSKNITVDSNIDVDISTNVSWLSLSDSSFLPGVNTLTVSLQNTSLLPIGTHPAEITITANGVDTIVNVLLTVVAKSATGLTSGGFYFAEARNRLELTASGSNREALLKFDTSASLGQKKYERKIPYYLNAISAVIGLETQKLLVPEVLPPNLNTRFFIPVKPISINLTVFDKTIGVNQLLPRAEFFDMLFINGKLPQRVFSEYFLSGDVIDSKPEDVVYRLSSLPTKQTLSKDAVVAFSFYSRDQIDNYSIWPPGLDLPAQFPINLTDTRIYSAFFNLADYSLSPGDKVIITCGLISTTIIIKDHDLPTVQLIWLNQWDCPEVFNCNGILEIEEEEESETHTLSRDGDIYTEITEIKEPRSFSIGTGKIYSEAEVQHLAGIVRAKKVWIQIGSNRYEVIPDFRSIKTHETRRFTREFKLDFISAKK